MNLQQTLTQARKNSTDYSTYRETIDQLTADGKTTGPNQSVAYVHYGKLGQTRMRRWDKAVKITPEIEADLNEISKKQTLVCNFSRLRRIQVNLLSVPESCDAHLCPAAS